MNSLIVLNDQTPATLDEIINLVTEDLIPDSNSQRAYKDAISQYLDWWIAQGKPAFSKSVVLCYRAYLVEKKYAPATINLRLTAIRKLARVAIEKELGSFSQAAGVEHIKNLPMRGVRAGNWLGADQVRRLINRPDPNTLVGLRDRAILAVLLGAGLRRSEVAALTVEHFQQREVQKGRKTWNRWVILDLTGKGGRVRSVPIADWTYQAVEAWCKAAGIEKGYIFLSLDRKYNGCTTRPHVSAQTILDVLKRYAGECGLNIAPHDCRRTFAHLARKGGAALDQIQQSLGHSTIATTERYLNTAQDLSCAPCDFLKLNIAI